MATKLGLTLVHVDQGGLIVGDMEPLDLLATSNDQEPKEYLIGRHPKCDLHLDSQDLPFFLSRQHAKMIVRGYEASIVDLGSLNGTFINNVMITPNTEMHLSVGDAVTFGCVAPDTTIVPGTAVKQENPRFRFILKEQPLLSKHDLWPSPNKTPKPVDNSTLHSVCKNDLNEEEIDDDTVTACLTPSGTCPPDGSRLRACQAQENQLPSSASTARNINDSASPPDQRDDRLNCTPKSNTLPLTVSNLIAYSGCKFKINNMDSSCDEKENKECPANSAQSKQCSSQIKGTPKRKLSLSHRKSGLKKRRSSNFTRSRNRKSGGAMEACSYFECRLKNGCRNKPDAVVSWVQCDTCDKWFHTECVGCDYEKVKLTSQKFQCGLC